MPENLPEALICSEIVCTLDKELVLQNGQTLAKGTTVLMLPRTVASCVLIEGTEEGKELTLADMLPKYSLQGHVHEDDQANLAEYAEQLLEYSNRLSAVELNNVDILSRLNELES